MADQEEKPKNLTAAVNSVMMINQLKFSLASSLTSPHIMVLARLKQATGNYMTANRIRKLFDDSKYICTSRDPESFTSLEEFHKYLEDNDICGVIGIHAFKAGRLLLDCPVPYAIILGGTDINELPRNDMAMQIMTKAIEGATRIIPCEDNMEKKSRSLWPLLQKAKIHTIYPGITTHPTTKPQFNLRKHFMLLEREPKLFTLIAGLRPVKDPLYLVQAFTEWHQLEARGVYLVILGAQFDEKFANHFFDVTDGCPGILYVGTLPTPEAHALVKRSFCLVNSSQSEGVCTAIVEAMKLGVPVIARNIPGNSAIITNEKTGLLYRTPEEFISKAQLLLKDQNLRYCITRDAKAYADEAFSEDKEQKAYMEVAKGLQFEAQQRLEERQRIEREKEEAKQRERDRARMERGEKAEQELVQLAL